MKKHLPSRNRPSWKRRLTFVIPSTVTFSIFSRFCTRPDIFQSPRKGRHPERSASQIYRITQGFMARSRRTPAMFVGRCSSELSGRRLQGKSKVTGSERSASQIYRIKEGFMARSRRTPAMLVGGCSSELSGHKLQGKLRKRQTPSEADLPRLAVGRAAEGSAIPRTLPGNVSAPSGLIYSSVEKHFQGRSAASFCTPNQMFFAPASKPSS